MYNLKKIFRKKNNYILIITFILTFLALIFLFKYIFVVTRDIENEIYDQYQNREIIIYNNSKDLINILIQNPNIIYIYDDYQTLEINNSLIGSFNITPLLNKDMPNLIKGTYPKKSNEIILPSFTIINNKKMDLIDYLNKEITFYLNNDLELKFKVIGIFNVEDTLYNVYYNLEYLNDLLTKTPYSKTNNLRALINHYKNVDSVIKEIGCNSHLYNTNGLEEIKIYTSLFNLVLLIIAIIIFFITIIIIATSLILFHDTKKERFIEFALGYNNNLIAQNYINYYLKIIIFSFIISFIVHIIIKLLYNKFISIDKLILNDLFKLSLNYTFILPIFLIIFFILIILYIILRIKLFKKDKFKI